MEGRLGSRSIHRSATWLVAISAAPLVALALVPGLHIRLPAMLNGQLHTVLEVASILVSVMIFSVSWYSLAWNRDSVTAITCSAFGCVAMADMAHVLLFESNSGFAAGTGMARVFIPFVAARMVTAAALLVLALEPRIGRVPPATRHLMTGVSVLFGLAAGTLGAMAGDSQAFFVPGVGLTALKLWLEWGLIALHLGAAALFIVRPGRLPARDRGLLAAALAVMALSEFAFTRYGTISDSYFVYGHVLKVVAYVVLYRMLFVRMLSQPYIELVEARRSLAETSERWRMLFEHSLDAVILGRPNGEVIAANPAACRLIGATQDELVRGGRRLISVDDDPRLPDLLHRRELDGHARGEVRFKRADGTVFEAEVASAVYRGSDGQPLSSVLIRDVTERRAVEAKVRELNETLERRVLERTLELERANAELAQFAWGIAHDLRAPLAAIGGFAGAVRERWAGQLPAPGPHYVDRIVSNVARMEDLIEAILGLHRLSRSELHARDLDLSAMARQVTEDLAVADPGRSVVVRIEPDLKARGDHALVQALLQNLLGNAWKFTGRTDDARIEFARDGCGWQVRDNGAGFSEDRSTQLFTLFRRLHNDSEFPGHGLGLAGARRIVERHGGAIAIEGKPGAGAIVRFHLGVETAT